MRQSITPLKRVSSDSSPLARPFSSSGSGARVVPLPGRGYNARAAMDIRISPAPRAAPPASHDPALLCSRSLLIYCRSSVVLSLLVFGALGAKIYSDLYVHLIRQAGRALPGPRLLPGAFFGALVAGALFLAFRMRPRLEKAALLILAGNLALFLVRRKADIQSDLYLTLSAFSLALDLGLLAALIAFYRRYPSLLRILRSPGPEPDDRRTARVG